MKESLLLYFWAGVTSRDRAMQRKLFVAACQQQMLSVL